MVMSKPAALNNVSAAQSFAASPAAAENLALASNETAPTAAMSSDFALGIPNALLSLRINCARA
jgi:hypothetical protein